MKIKTTAKAVKASQNLVSAPYAALQNLLKGHEPIAYTSGVYGWNFDVYEVEGLTIATGYRNMPGRLANNYREYEEKARAIWSDYATPYEERKSAVDQLLSEFVAQA